MSSPAVEQALNRFRHTVNTLTGQWAPASLLSRLTRNSKKIGGRSLGGPSGQTGMPCASPVIWR